MGADSRKAPPLPAPTETDSNTGRETEVDSRVTEKTTYSLHSDGSPVTIRTKNRSGNDQGLSSNNKSQTSLLIEYFEGGKSGQPESRRPSVRVKVTPSSKSRSRSVSEHIQITERKGTRRPSYTKRIQLSPNAKGDKSPGLEGDDHSLKSYRSATEESNVSRGGEPIDIEIMPRRHGSPLIPTGESSSKYVPPNASDISSMPTDSFLDGKTRSPDRKRSRSLTRGEALVAGAATGLAGAVIADKLKTPSRRRSRSLSRERIVVQKAVEKVRGDKSERRRKHRSRSRSVSGEQLEGTKSPRRRSSRSHHEDSMVSGTASILNSQVSGKSGDQYSFRSGTSKSSINNPKLLETVEDAIRRLILPELATLKREQSKHAQRERDRRGSITSGSAVSRDSKEGSSSAKGAVEGTSGKSKEVETGPGKSRKDRVKYEDSPRSFERETSEETVIRDGDTLRKSRSGDKHRGLEAAAIGAGIGALAAAAVHKNKSQDSLGEKERRRRRTRSHSRSGSRAESYEDREQESHPPMPLMSDINQSELTRSSILSADTERPHSASQEPTPVQEVVRGVGSPASRTPTRTPVGIQSLGIQHSNYSRENVSIPSQRSLQQQPREQEYELDEQGRKVPMYEEDEHVSYIDGEHGHESGNSHAVGAGLAGAAVGAAAGAGLAAMHDHYEHHDDPELLEDEPGYSYYNYQEVPPPLRYVPYAQERRGLSPIQSVSGYTEGDPDPQHPRNSQLTRSTGSYSSLNKSMPVNSSGRSAKSIESASNRHDFAEVRTGGLADSELTQEGEYWEEHPGEIDRNRDFDSESYRSSDPRVDYKRMTNYTDDSMEPVPEDHVASGQNVRGIAANPDYVHTPVAVESAVASLVNGSELTNDSGQYDRRESYASYDDGSEAQFASRKNSPSKRDTFGTDQELPSQRNSPAKYEGEYELDDQGRKITMPTYKKQHTLEKAGLATIAAGAAAHVLARERQKKAAAERPPYESRTENSGAPLQKSFKDRAREGQGKMLSPRQSIDESVSDVASPDQPKMTSSGLPDLHNPMPEVGYGDGDSDMTTNPPSIQGAINETQPENRDHWPSHATPPRKPVPIRSQGSDPNVKAAEIALLGAGAAAAAAAATASHNRDVSRETNDEDWQRTSGERKRDTLVTNPYEGTSPIAAIGSGLDRDLLGQTAFQDVNRDFGASKLGYPGSPGAMPKDEGYISSAPNARSVGGGTPKPRIKGVNFLDNDGVEDETADIGGDPFYTPAHARHLSGMSQGMQSPLYDSATGNGIDRIQSKDIIALMDHVNFTERTFLASIANCLQLTVRDAQRSARDTEILVTLVRAAAEMRNSFEDMKRLLADTEDVIITEVQTNTERSVQKAINGPRPQPPSGARSLRQGSQDEYEDIPTKRRNVFRRALKGLSMRSSNDLGKIEDMLVQLLGEVEGLKIAQGLKAGSHQGTSTEELHQEGNYENDRGYEPEGNAGTSIASQSGHLSNPLSTGGARAFDGRKFSDHRISTVPEGDEEDLETHHQEAGNVQYDNEHLMTPIRENIRAGSAPLGTPPQQNIPPASLSNENTPRTDKSKKHKSSSSSGWIPKVSRWSETTASTVLRGFRSSGRSSGRKDDQFAEPRSRSGSDLAEFEHDPYGADMLNSPDYLQENEAAAQLPPPEDPKYKAHRNSLLLEHPQPRQGPTHRYQTALENQAQNFDTPMSPASANWSQTSLNRLPPQQTNRYSGDTNITGPRSPTSEVYSNTNMSPNQQPPVRPPKEPITPQVPAKIRVGRLQKPSPLANEHLSPERQYRAGSPQYEPGGSPRSAARKLSGALGGVPTRKPTGPRSMSTASKSGELNRDDGTVRRANRGMPLLPPMALYVLERTKLTPLLSRYIRNRRQQPQRRIRDLLNFRIIDH